MSRDPAYGVISGGIEARLGGDRGASSFGQSYTLNYFGTPLGPQYLNLNLGVNYLHNGSWGDLWSAGGDDLGFGINLGLFPRRGTPLTFYWQRHAMDSVSSRSRPTSRLIQSLGVSIGINGFLDMFLAPRLARAFPNLRIGFDEAVSEDTGGQQVSRTNRRTITFSAQKRVGEDLFAGDYRNEQVLFNGRPVANQHQFNFNRTAVGSSDQLLVALGRQQFGEVEEEAVSDFHLTASHDHAWDAALHSSHVYSYGSSAGRGGGTSSHLLASSLSYRVLPWLTVGGNGSYSTSSGSNPNRTPGNQSALLGSSLTGNWRLEDQQLMASYQGQYRFQFQGNTPNNYQTHVLNLGWGYSGLAGLHPSFNYALVLTMGSPGYGGTSLDHRVDIGLDGNVAEGVNYRTNLSYFTTTSGGQPAFHSSNLSVTAGLGLQLSDQVSTDFTFGYHEGSSSFVGSLLPPLGFGNITAGVAARAALLPNLSLELSGRWDRTTSSFGPGRDAFQLQQDLRYRWGRFSFDLRYAYVVDGFSAPYGTFLFTLGRPFEVPGL